MAAKIAQEPIGSPEGYDINISPEEAEEHNLRILSFSNASRINKAGKRWFLPKQEKLPLLFFRRIFTGLRAQQETQANAREMVSKKEGDLRSLRQKSDDGEDTVPLEAFQRAFERLFFMLGDESGFDAKSCDENGNGLVGWAEFSYIFQILQNRNFAIHYTWSERIYLTFDNPDSSYIASFLSVFVLLTIIASSLSFILGTRRHFQEEPVGLDKPEPQKALMTMESICLAIFLVEYLVRLFTCWAVRPEVANKDKLLSTTLGYGPLVLQSPIWRLVMFIFSPANIIDLVAILPGVIQWIDEDLLEGGGFVVLRLLRLTRIFRLFKNPKVNEPVIVIKRTMDNSTKALYLLFFNFVLGILISGSLMYLVEGNKGEWDPSTQTYLRKAGEDKWQQGEDIMVQTPFESIPHSFWWAIVTSTTVGYGDDFPTTSLGYVIATITMVFSLVIAALPVGILGENFTQVWDDYAMEKRLEAAELDQDKKSINAAIQKIDPFEYSKLMYIEVYNERLAEDRILSTEPAKSKRPDIAEFLGRAIIVLELDQKANKTDVQTVKLQDGEEGSYKKAVTGAYLTVQYEWMPDQVPEKQASPEYEVPMGKRPTLAELNGRSEFLQGQLKVTVQHAEGLHNVCYNRGKKCGANPYCRVFCYANSPSSKKSLCPSAWRSPMLVGAVAPKWCASHTFNFKWKDPRDSPDSPEVDLETENRRPSRDESAKPSSSQLGPEPDATRSDGTFAGPIKLSDRGEVSHLVRTVGSDLNSLREEMRALANRVASLG